MPDPTSEPAAAPVPGARRPGELIGGRYRLTGRLARGGMAEVWEAEDEVLARPVAVKALLPHLAADDGFLRRFRREAVAAARLSHPHIVSIYDTCASDGCEAIVMELVRGRTLRDVLDQDGALPLKRAVHVAAQVADALDHAHASGLVHRDVKPGNILLAADGRVLVTDFGIAKAAESSGADLTEVGQVVGTAKYLSPEQVEGGPVDARSDVYALGVVLYEALCGRPPFVADTSTATAVARLTSAPLRPRQVRAGIPRALEELVLRAMARRPEDRFPTAGDMRGALERLDLSRVDDQDDDEGEILDRTPLPPPMASERSWMVPAVLIVVVAVTLGVVGMVLRRTDVGADLFGGDLFGEDDPAGDPPGPAPRIVAASDFDPFAGDGEHPESARLAIDGDPATAWITQTYLDPSNMGKEGVGLYVELAEPAEVATVTVRSPTEGWRGAIYTADAPAAGLAGWGPAAAEVAAGEEPTVEIELEPRRAGAVLLWLTYVGPTGRFELSELRVAA